ncbi:hypothetical protein FQN54_000402 [Arachnomyces sp. PD_36]|nr:hypothetical protein FQN54_000402 [Arachnomyces sp. PD_36]
MEKIHSRAVDAIQPFIHMAASQTSATPRFISNLITNATSAPNTYVFAELLDVPAVQSLRSPETPEEYRTALTLLEIFAWGTWEEYHATPNLPPLNSEQTQKLRLLTLLSLCTSQKSPTYQSLMTSLSLPDSSALESLITTAIYSSLLTARLSPTTTPPIVRVTSIAPLRDIRPQTVTKMISVLSEWEERCGDVIGGIEAEIAKIKAEAEKNRVRERERTKRVERSISGWDGDKDDGSSATGGGGSGGGRGVGSRTSQAKDSLRGLRQQGRQFFSGSGSGSGAGNRNKREFATTEEDDEDVDDGYFEDDGGVDISGHHGGSSSMDIDDGAGAPVRGSMGSGSSGGGGAAAMRGAKRMLAMGKKSG